MKLFSAGKEDQMTQNQNGPVLAPMPVRHQPRQFSEVAARAAQHVHDLEMMIESLQADVHALTARLTVADERAKAAREECEYLMRDRDYHKERCIKIETHLNNAAHMILEAMAVPTKKEDEPPAISLADINVEPEQPRTNGNGKRKTADPKTPPVPSED